LTGLSLWLIPHRRYNADIFTQRTGRNNGAVTREFYRRQTGRVSEEDEQYCTLTNSRNNK